MIGHGLRCCAFLFNAATEEENLVMKKASLPRLGEGHRFRDGTRKDPFTHELTSEGVPFGKPSLDVQDFGHPIILNK